MWEPLQWSYRHPWATWLECLKLNPGPLTDQCMLLPTQPSLQLLLYSFMILSLDSTFFHWWLKRSQWVPLVTCIASKSWEQQLMWQMAESILKNIMTGWKIGLKKIKYCWVPKLPCMEKTRDTWLNRNECQQSLKGLLHCKQKWCSKGCSTAVFLQEMKGLKHRDSTVGHGRSC